VLKGFTGYAIHDCLAAYFSFSDAKHGLCNAHILRELQALIEDKSQWAQAMRDLLLELHEELPGSTLSTQAAELLRQRYRQILRQADEDEPPPIAKEGKDGPKTRREETC
jgi:transposase